MAPWARGETDLESSSAGTDDSLKSSEFIPVIVCGPVAADRGGGGGFRPLGHLGLRESRPPAIRPQPGLSP